MTRLVPSDILQIGKDLPEYDFVLEKATGYTLKGLGMKTASMAMGPGTDARMAALRVAVVPVTGSLGVLPGFSDAMVAILEHLGFGEVNIVEPDVVGMAQATDDETDILFMADDLKFIALCPREGVYIDNDEATAEGYVTGLSLMAGGLMGKGVLVIGCGRIGTAAAVSLIRQNAEVTLIDRDTKRSRELIQRLEPVSSVPLFLADDLEAAVRSHSFIFDASNAADIIHEADLSFETYVAAPGMPCGIGPKARKKLLGRMIHDPLQLGVSVMACMALRKLHR
jgi:3-methylornithyl-N6-L-lysine dehydrogenase